LFKFTTVFGNINYSKTSDPVVNRAYFNGINQVSEKVNASFENESVNGLRVPTLIHEILQSVS
jgi:hypothetical protein